MSLNSVRRVIPAVLFGAAVLMLPGFGPGLLRAQGTAAASIAGRVLDDSGAPVPGVSVTVTSPALQVPQVATATDAEGAYKFPDLPAPGVYKAAFSRDGFQTFIRGELNLSVGFAARVDVSMKVGQVSQTVEVTGETPVVDTVNTAAGTTLEQTEIALTPRGLGLQELFPMAAGVSVSGKPDVGDSNLAARSTIITYGVLLEPALEVEGINITTSHDLDTGVYFDSYSLAEAEFKTVANNADVAFPGVHMVATMKSGSNSFHGSALGDWESPRFQGSNVSPALAAQGVRFTNPIRSYFDYAGDFGGRLIRDKLWFYGGISNQKVIQGQLGFVSGPDAAGCWTCADAPQANVVTALPQENLKLSWQLNQNTRLLGVWQHAQKFLNAQGASSTQPFPSTQFEHQPEDLYKGEIQMSLSPHLLFDALAGYGGYHVHYLTQPGTDVAGNPSSQELSTKLFTGPYYMPTDKPQDRYQAKGNMTWIAGPHQLKFGTDVTFEQGNSQVLKDKVSGDYLLLFNKGLPTQIQLFNYPITPVNQLNSQAFYVTDTWKLGRVALNYGLRWERYHAFYPVQNKLAGQFSPAATFPGQDLLTWKDFAPRVGAAWDIFGNGKTVVKGSFGLFGDTMGDLWGNTFNPNGIVTTTYKWTGPCVATPFRNVSYDNSSCDIGPATLGALNPSSSNFIGATGGLNELNNPKLKQDRTREYSLRIERQVVPNVVVSGSYVQHRVYNLYNSGIGTTTSTANGINILRPYSIYNVPVTLPDALTGESVTLYTYPGSYSGSSFNQLELMNAPGNRQDTYHTFEVAVAKKYSKRWNGQASFWTTKNHEWIQAISPSPNDDRFPIDNTRNWEARGSGVYSLPWGFDVSGFYRAQSGQQGQRTESFSSPLLVQGAVTLRMEPFGAQRGSFIQIANLKFAKSFSLGESRRLQFNFQLFNIFNSSSATSTSYLTGPTYLHTTGIVSPRVGRVGMQFSF